MMRAQILGPLGLRVAGKQLKLGGIKQRVLLATLILAEGQAVSVARLQEAMWGGSSPDRDHGHALQAHVSRLRSMLPVPIELGPGGYRIDTSEFDLDAVQFSELVASGRARLDQDDPGQALKMFDEALDLWRGPALADLAHVLALQPSVVRLEELRQRATTDRVTALLRLGRPGDVIPGLYARLEEFPLEEHTWHQLISSLQQSDRLSEAMACYHRARDTFVEELGSEPGPALTALHQRLLRATTLTATAPEEVSLAPAIGRFLSTPITGRDRELALIRQACATADDGLHLVTITGEPGIGKTRLAAEFADERVRGGSPVLFGRCDEFMTVPYQPFAEMIRAHVEGLTGTPLARALGPYPAELARIVPDLAERLPAGLSAPLRSDPQTELYRTFDAVAGWLAVASRTAPLTLLLDDLQWADRPTVLLVRHLTHSPRRMRTLLLATLRDREHLQSGSTSDLLGHLVQQSGAVSTVSVSRLREADVASLVDLQGLGSPAAARDRSDLVAWLTTASGGNPLFVVELIRNIIEDGIDTTAPGLGRLPVGVREVIRGRLARLPDGVRPLIEIASVQGATFDVHLLADASRRSPADIESGLAAAEAAWLIKPTNDSGAQWAFSHDVVRSALYDEIPPLRRGLLHHRIAEALEARLDSPGLADATQLAHHFTLSISSTPDGEGPERAIRYLRSAGDKAMEQQAPAVAADHYQDALELLPGSSPVADQCELMIALGTALFRSGNPGFREVLLKAGRLALRDGDPHHLAAAAVANSRGWWSSTAAVDHERIAIIEAAMDRCDPDDAHLRCQLLASWALENVRDPAQRSEVARRASAALELAEQLGDEELLGFTLSHCYAVTYATFSDPRACVDLSERIFRLSRRRADPGLRLNATIGLAQATATLGEFTVSDQALDQALELGEKLHQPARLWMARTWHAMRLATRGRIEEAEAEAIAAYELGTETGQPDAFTWFAGQLFTFRLLDGRLPELFDEIEEQAHSQASGIPSWQAAYALALTTVGRHDDAAKILDNFVARDFAQLPLDMLWLHAMAYLSMVSEALGDTVAARAIYAALLPHRGLIAHNGTINAGPVDLYLGLLARMLGDEEHAAEHLEAAEEACLRMEAPHWLERVRLGRGREPGM
ncbi:BTAD domain-containing putative transcriptional regulator [Nocardioides sp. AE5]|uniref:ATP-binding protein n=1 Tax=Nocardioides sp. AE5 TaxID=2962573 RepID=UPI00288228E3|nr:BTAD domain-containing putative transcriptional regulator [Nocardioides sp. AE5]MDT0200475.1 BTAD domain-containing putative transcriptional regulator [Nocardioides sp. AE5]